MASIPLTSGMTVRNRGERFTVVDIALLSSRDKPVYKLYLRGLEGELQGKDKTVLYPIDSVEPDEIPPMSLENPGRIARFRLLHDVFRLQIAPPTDTLVGVGRSRIRFEPYQYVPALRALDLPRPRLLLADDVGLGKTIEAGLVLQDLAARRRASRILIVCPAGIMGQWQEELESKFGFKFKVFDRDTIHEVRLTNEVGTNPWAVEPRVIASMDFMKRREGAFRELAATKWDVVIVDEAHHLSSGRSEDDVTDRHRLGRWLADATDALLLLTATPHDGYDESFSSLLSFLEPSLVMPEGPLRFNKYRRHLVRRLKKHIRNEDGSEKFLERKVEPIPVSLTPEERELHEAVMSQAREMEALASKVKRRFDAEAIRLVATVLRKRAASSRAALEQTIRHRFENLGGRIEDLEVQRDHLRALRRGEALPDESLARLEREAHISYLSVVRRLGRQVRRAEAETEALDHLYGLVQKCKEKPDSKIIKLHEAIKKVHDEFPDDKVIIFSEYFDTVSAIVDSLSEKDCYKDKVCQLSGEFPMSERKKVLQQFASKEKLILVATEAAGEGLNLHRNCHRILHFELPWNPNRLEQRNGRIDRYGQNHTPVIGFLYAEETYEGEVLARIVIKIENQIRSLGSVGDVLGQIQSDRIEQMVSRSPENFQSAIEEAQREIDEEIGLAQGRNISRLLGDGGLNEEEIKSAREAVEKGTTEDVGLQDFLGRAITAAGTGGRLIQQNEGISVQTPRPWLSMGTESSYGNLVVPTPGTDMELSTEEVLDEHHPLIKAAVRWVKASRFSRGDDHRLAYALTSKVTEPDLVATYLISIRDGEGLEQERLEAVLVNSRGEVSEDRGQGKAALGTQGEGNLETNILASLFETWWENALESALEEAQRRASFWQQRIIARRNLVQDQFKTELNIWNEASRRAILGKYQEQRSLFGELNIPPAIRRKLRHHDERFRQRLDYLDQCLRFDQPIIEHIGVLLRVPASLVQGKGA